MNEKKRGLMIVNLGSPDSCSVPDVRKYLNEFLMDERVIDIPYLIRTIVVKGFIVPFRAPKSAAAYKTIWTDRGSPLKVITDDFAVLVESKINMPVAVAMRYGNPNPAEALKQLETKAGGELDEILIAPMYPHYAMSSYETALEHVKKHIGRSRKNLKLRVLKPFYSEPAYISSLAESIRPHIADNDFDGYLFSYHGLPIRHLKKSDPTGSHCYSSDDCCEIKSLAWETCYKHQVKATTKLVAEKLNLDWKKVIISFQSRLGNGWIEPFTDNELEELPKRGVKRLLVLCPAFVADCLETLEEMDDRGKELFMSNGGETYVRVPCINTSAKWIDAFAAYCNGYEAAYEKLWT
jgi:ferrochelatase